MEQRIFLCSEGAYVCACDRISLNFVLNVVRRSCADRFLHSVEADEEKQWPISPVKIDEHYWVISDQKKEKHNALVRIWMRGKFVVLFFFCFFLFIGEGGELSMSRCSFFFLSFF